ncbi:MAG TPA: PilN domain-containing protein [Burkholderiales bacterium]|jgi:type IV pilus assembly protein PilN|nr:PilN domain-containing protein [Burkholderiales bacterium]
MIPINLLPHRAERRKAQQRQFFVLAGMIVGLGAAIVVAVHGLFATRIENQLDRNKYLQTEIAALDKQIDEIKKLKEQTQALLARKRVVETLQTNRTETVRLLDQMVRQLPDGVHLKTVKQTGQKVNVIGYATSNARVSTLMRNLEASPWLEGPSLIEVKATKLGKDNIILNEFILNVTISRPKEEAAPGAKPAAPATPAGVAAPKA